MNSSRRCLAPTVLVLALVAALLFAATAAAEVRTGEANSPVDMSIPGEFDLLGATASYDSTAGTVTITVTTREEPAKSNPNGALLGVLATVPGTCTTGAESGPAFPVFLVGALFDEEVAEFDAVEEGEAGGEPVEFEGPATKSVAGATTTLAATTSKAAGRPYNCVGVSLSESGGSPEDSVLFPLKAPPAPVVAPAPTLPVAPAPAALSFAKLKPLKLKSGKWTRLRVKVSNAGGTAVGPIAIKAKAPAGVVLKPGTAKLPALLPGQTWTVVFEAKLTANAKAKSTVSFTGSAGSLTAKGSLALRLAG